MGPFGTGRQFISFNEQPGLSRRPWNGRRGQRCIPGLGTGHVNGVPERGPHRGPRGFDEAAADAQAAAETLAQWADHSADSEERDERARAAFEAHFTRAHTVEAYRRLFTQMHAPS